LFWSLLGNLVAFVALSLWRPPSAREASQALLFVDVFRAGPSTAAGLVFWRGRAQVRELLPLASRFLGPARATQLFGDFARRRGVAGIEQIPPDAQLVQFVETQLAGAIGSASARVMVATAVEEEPLGLDDVMRILDEASQLRAANEQLKSVDRLKDDFMSSVTHELRTPLTSIRALSEMMADDPEMPAPQRVQFLHIINAETERLTRLVNQVLDMAKIEAGQAQWHTTDVSLRELLAHAVQTTAEMFRERGATVRLDAPHDAPTLRLDADRLTQVLLNLLSNAAKFLPAEGGRVDVRLRLADAGVRVEIQDNGSGVAPDQRALIFEKFRQGGDAANRPPGTGLGLPISRQIVEHFGGRMWLQPVAAPGACFAFELPWQTATEPTGDKA
jgi:signal transduction histidine kinase